MNFEEEIRKHIEEHKEFYDEYWSTRKSEKQDN